MAHLIDMSNGRANIAYAGDVPWHGLGANVDADESLDVWMEKAGFNWEVKKAPVVGLLEDGSQIAAPNRWVLHRSDTRAALSVMSSNYNITQPREVAEFFRELVEAGGFKMETLGMLRGGAIYWALAKVDDSFDVGQGDNVLPYLLLATSCDGTLSNVAQFTTVRVVCNNTLTVAANNKSGQIRVPHSTKFDPVKFKTELGVIGGSWERFKSEAVELSKREVSRAEAVQFFLNVFYPDQTIDLEDKIVRPQLAQVLSTYENGVGQSVATASGTAWGLLNAVTRYTDHEKKAASNDNRLQSAWFGAGARFKARAYDEALALLAA